MNDDLRYVFVIKNGLEDFIDLFSFDIASVRVDIMDGEDIPDAVSKLDEELVKERILLIAERNIANSQGLLNLVIKSFSVKFKFFTPYFLYLTKEELSKNEEDIITKGENYFYKLPDVDRVCFERYNFNHFIKFIFHKLLTHERLNYYIVDSFQTIIDSEMIANQKREIEKLNKEIMELSKIDFLTNLLNRRAFYDALEAEKKRTLRDNWRLSSSNSCVKNCDNSFTAHPEGKFLDHFGRFSCVLIDIDFFKKINDNYGHLVGDMVLKKIGEVLNSKMIFRENDIIARYGGEEFILILPETNSINAKTPTNRLREYFKTIDFFDEDNRSFNVTLSLGISEFNPKDKTNEELIQRADQALYLAKEQGRDRVVVYEENF